MNLIETKNIFLKEGDKEILKDISLNIAQDDFISIIGPNGAGKTTLLKIILGITKADKGVVNKKKNLRIGYVPQKINIDHSLPVNVKYFLMLCAKINKTELQKIVSETKIEMLLDKNIYDLSGGEMQRILLAKALINNPEILILDEPAQNLDLNGQIEFYKLLQEIYKEKKIAILMVSHDLHMIMSATKKVVCLYKHICCQGEPEAVSKNPEFISIFGKDMSKLISVYNHFHDHEHG
jgi:zinc transport system ATP-binding protein